MADSPTDSAAPDTELLDWFESYRPTAIYWPDHGGGVPAAMSIREFLNEVRRAVQANAAAGAHSTEARHA